MARIGHVVSNTTRTGFDTISFNNPPLVQDTFYIGFQQYTENYVGVGFDKDHAGGTSFIFSNTNNIWEQNSALVGSMMIRPVVDNQDSIVMNIQVLEKNSIVIFPNPSTGIFHIEGNYDYINISDLSGHQVFTSKQLDIVDLSLLRKGIYLCQFVKDNNIVTKKIMIQ